VIIATPRTTTVESKTVSLTHLGNQFLPAVRNR
jgi:hypothetical protein